MIHTVLKRIVCIITAMVCLTALTCVQSVGGGPGTGSETTNGFVATIRYQDGTPVASASVKLRPSDYLKEPADGISKRSEYSHVDTQTDSSGRFSLLDIDPIDYFIEVLDPQKTEGVLISGRAQRDTVTDYGIVYLDPVGSITGTVDTVGLPENTTLYVQVFGLDRVERIDAESGDFRVEDVAAGDYTVRLVAREAPYLPEVIGNVTVVPSIATVIDTVVLTPLNSWCCMRNIHLNTTKSGADVGATITKLPVLVRLDSGNFDFNAARVDGGDLRFTKADNTPLPYQIERWDPENNRAEVWVRIDTVFGNSDSHYFIMRWGNPDATTEAGSEAVFDTAMGFEGVWHMNEADSSGVGDATAHHYNGRKYAMGTDAAVEGMCGPSQRFDGKSNYIVISNTASGTLNFPEDGIYSVSAWVSAEVLDGDYHSIISKGNQQYGLQLSKDNMWQFFEYRDLAGWDAVEAGAEAGQWCYLTAVCAGKDQFLYVNGVLVDSTITYTEAGIKRITTDNVFIGRRTLDTTRYWNGMIDEVRICSWPHSANWIRLCFMNQKTEDQLLEFRDPPIGEAPESR